MSVAMAWLPMRGGRWQCAVFVFFQAEDGIRDLLVTGVQTCALPISISKRLAEAMGGAIGVESEPGQGSTFWFTIALTEAKAPAAADDQAKLEWVKASARILVV